MKKIKNFKIALKARDAARRYKAGQNPSASAAELEVLAENAVSRWGNTFTPATVFESYWKQKAPASLTPLFQEENEAAVAVSAILVAVQRKGLEKAEAPWDKVIEEESLERALRFAGQLVAQEAEEERCDLTVFKSVEDPALAQNLLGLLGGDKIGVTGGQDTVSFKVATVGWVARKKTAKR